MTEFNTEDKAFIVKIIHIIGIGNVGKKNEKERYDMAFLKFIDKVEANNFLSENIWSKAVEEYKNQENAAVAGKQDFAEGRFLQQHTTLNGNPINVRFESDETLGHVLCLYHMDDELDVNGLKK